MNSNIKIVQADYQNTIHATAIVELMDHYACDPMGGGKPLSEFARENMIEMLEMFPTAFTVLAFDGEKAVGLVNCFETLSTFYCKPLINIHDIVVSESHRGKGIGYRLLEKVEQLAKEKGCCKLTLEVLEGNNLAQGVYRKFGFTAYELDPAMGKALFWEKEL